MDDLFDRLIVRRDPLSELELHQRVLVNSPVGEIERELFSQSMISEIEPPLLIGVDEAGRGPWAGCSHGSRTRRVSAFRAARARRPLADAQSTAGTRSSLRGPRDVGCRPAPPAPGGGGGLDLRGRRRGR